MALSEWKPVDEIPRLLALANEFGCDAAVAAVNGFRTAPTPGPVTIAVGCVGGRHRSAVIAAEIARRIGPGATLTHRDITRPVIERRTTGDGT